MSGIIFSQGLCDFLEPVLDSDNINSYTIIINQSVIFHETLFAFHENDRLIDVNGIRVYVRRLLGWANSGYKNMKGYDHFY